MKNFRRNWKLHNSFRRRSDVGSADAHLYSACGYSRKTKRYDHIYDIGGSKGRDGARARAPILFLDQTEARRAGKNDFRSRISLLSLNLDQNNNEEFKFATWKTRRELEPKCVPQMFLGWLLGARRSAIGQFFAFSPSNIPRSLCESKSTQFLSRILRGESPQPHFDKKRPLQRKGHAEWRLALKVTTTIKIQSIH